MPEQPHKRGRGRPPRQQSVRNQFPIMVQMPTDLVAALDQEMQRSGAVSRSEVIRRACIEYLERRENKEKA